MISRVRAGVQLYMQAVSLADRCPAASWLSLAAKARTPSTLYYITIHDQCSNPSIIIDTIWTGQSKFASCLRKWIDLLSLTLVKLLIKHTRQAEVLAYSQV